MPATRIFQPSFTITMAMIAAAILSRGKSTLWPMRARKTRAEVSTSALCCTPSAIRLGDPVCFPTRI